MRKPAAGYGRLAACLAALAVLSSCSGPVVTAVGDANDLLVIYDAGSADLADLAVAAVESPRSWLLDEPSFKTTPVTFDESGGVRNLRHVLLVGTTDGGETGEMILSLFRGLRKDAAPELHVIEDVWAKRQVVAAVVGPDAETLAAFLRDNGEQIRDEMEAAALTRLTSSLRAAATEAGMAAAMHERFGWSVSPPTGYDLFTTDEENNFIFFRRTRPDRTVFVHWETGRPEFVSEQYALAKREELAAAYLDGDAIEWNRPVEAEPVEFLGRPAVRVSAWWGNRELVGGGPFRTYCFFDPATERVYMLDVSLFAPSYDKTSLMRNLDAVAHTFTLEE